MFGFIQVLQRAQLLHVVTGGRVVNSRGIIGNVKAHAICYASNSLRLIQLLVLNQYWKKNKGFKCHLFCSSQYLKIALYFVHWFASI